MEVGINSFLQLPGKYSFPLSIEIYKSIPLTDVGSLVRNNFANKELYNAASLLQQPIT
jgi:hypothetical protein